MVMFWKNETENGLNLSFFENKDFSNFSCVPLGRVSVPLPYLNCYLVRSLSLDCTFAYGLCTVALGFCTFAFYVPLPYVYVLLGMVFVLLVTLIVFLLNDFVLLQSDTNGL